MPVNFSEHPRGVVTRITGMANAPQCWFAVRNSAAHPGSWCRGASIKNLRHALNLTG